MSKVDAINVEIKADTKGFDKGMEGVKANSKKTTQKVVEDAKKIGAAFGAAFVGAAAAIGTFTVKTAESAREIKNLSRVANTNAQEFQKMVFAAQRFGIEQDKVSDILKDVNDRVGDFIQTGAGPMADFFEKVAPKVGVTAENFKNLSGRESLQLYVDTLQRANVSQQEMTFYLEAMASDATMLLPLLKNNGQALKELGDEAERTGNVLSETDFKQLEELDATIFELESTFKGLAKEIAVNAAPVMQELVETLKDPAVVQGIKDIANAIISFTSAVIKATAETAEFTRFLGEELAAAVSGPALDDIPRVEDHVESLTQKLETLNKRSQKFGGTTRYNEQIKEAREELAKYQQALDNFNKTGNAFGFEAPPAPPAPSSPIVFGIEINGEFVENAKRKAEQATTVIKSEFDLMAESLNKMLNDPFKGEEASPERFLKMVDMVANTQQQMTEKVATEAQKRTQIEIEQQMLARERALQDLDWLNQMYMTREEAQLAAFERDKAMLDQHLANKAISQQEYADEMARIEEAKANAERMIAIKGFKDIFSALGQHNEKMLKVAKAFAIAEAVVSIARGIAKAQELGFPANIAEMARVAATGAQVYSMIKGASASGASAAAAPSGGGAAASAPPQQQQQQPSRTFNVNMVGSQQDTQAVRGLLEKINEEAGNGFTINTGG